MTLRSVMIKVAVGLAVVSAIVGVGLFFRHWGPRRHAREPGVLQRAIGLGDEAEVRLLLDNGADVNDDGYFSGFSPLHMAVICDRRPIAELLLDRGASVSQADKNGMTPLHLAAVFGGKDAVELLLGRQANLNAPDGAGDTPLHWAARYGNAEAVRSLLVAGADPFLRNKHGNGPLAMAAPRRLPPFPVPGITASPVVGADRLHVLASAPALPRGANLEGEVARALRAAMDAKEPEAADKPVEYGKDVVLKEGFPGYAEVLVEFDTSGRKRYRLVYPPSGRKKPWDIAGGGAFDSLAALGEEIRGLKDVAVTTSDPRGPTSMWIIGDERLEPLSSKETAELQALLARNPSGQ